jgi:hypothetical protein
MASSGMLRRVGLVGTDVSEALSSSETSVLTRPTRRNIPEDVILHSHRHENLRSYIIFSTFTYDSIGGRSVGIVRLRTKGHGVCLFFFYI